MALGITVDFNANISPISGQIDRLLGDLDRFRRDTQRSATDASSAIDKIGNSLKNMALGYVSISALKGLASDILDTNRAMETLRMQLTAVEGSADGSRRAFDFITKFAVETPFEIDGLTKSFVSLQNFGINPTTKVMEAITNQAAKLGGSQENLTGITLALGQAWAKGKLQGQEILQLVNQGVPVWDLLTKVTGKSSAELQKMSENGELTRETISKLIEKMGEMAAGSNALAMDTLNGKISNLSDSWHKFEDTLMGSKTEAMIKSITGAAGHSLDILSNKMSVDLDNQIAQVEGRIARIKRLGVVGTVVGKMEGYTVEGEEIKKRALQTIKENQDAADAEAVIKKASAAEVAMTADWLAEVETADADKTEKAHKKSASAAESAAKKAVSAAQSIAKAEASRAESIKTLMDNLQFEISISDKDATAQRLLTDIRSATSKATASEADALTKLITTKYSLAEADAVLAEGEKLALKQRTDSAADYDRLNAKFNGKSLDFNQGLSDALDARHTPTADGSSTIIPNDTELKKVLDQMGKDYNGLTDTAAKSTDKMSEYAVQAAHNMQSAFADFLFDPFKTGVGGMATNFLTALQHMAANAASAQIMEGLLGKTGVKDGGGLLGAAASGLGGMLSGASSSPFNGTGMLTSMGNSSVGSSIASLLASFFHDGGVVGSGGTHRPVSSGVFSNAHRYHSGGIAGLMANEVPAILQRGELVISNKQLAAGGKSTAQNSVVNNVTVQVQAAKGDDASATGQKAAEAFMRAIAQQEITSAARPGNQLNRTTRIGA